ncbi:Prefoldin subunit alpha [uncultured archaeon]|nr:Prefoldin subunit alpha [uncultured archaeon]
MASENRQGNSREMQTKEGGTQANNEEKKMTLTGPQLMQLGQQERSRLEQLNTRISSLQGARNELFGAKDALKELSNADKGTKIMVNLGAGIYAEASIEDCSKATTAIAGNVFREKKADEIIKEIESRTQSIEKQLGVLGQEQQSVIARVNQLESIIQAGAAYMQQARQKPQ